MAYVPESGTLFVSSEKNQQIREYDLDGNPTGRAMTIPADMAKAGIQSNKGFESLTYNAATGLFWTTTEDALKKDTSLERLLRLQSFGQDLKPGARYFYRMDAPSKSASEASAAKSYVFGVPALAAPTTASDRPLWRSLRAASSKAPTPGRMILSAPAISAASALTFASAPIMAKELFREKRLPTP